MTIGTSTVLWQIFNIFLLGFIVFLIVVTIKKKKRKKTSS